MGALTVRPRICLSGARAAYVGPGLRLAPHRNAVATVALGLGEPFRLTLVRRGARAQQTWVALIPPGTLHHVEATGAMAFIYLDALSDDLDRLQHLDRRAARVRVDAAGAQVLDWGVDAYCAALGVPRRPPVDVRIRRVIRAIDERPQDFPSVTTAAAVAGLSPSRFAALLSESVGVPFRRYRTWRRMAVVLKAVARGETLTEAAHEAGFASSAHLSTTFRQLFGLTPSAVVAVGARLEVSTP